MPLAIRPLPAMLAVLLLLPAAAADPGDGIVETTEPPLPLPVDPDTIVKVHGADVDADPRDGGMGASGGSTVASTAIMLQCASAGGGSAAVCNSYVCLKGPGNGSLLSLGDPGQGTYGVGADLDKGSEAEPEDHSYTGAFVNLQGQCGP